MALTKFRASPLPNPPSEYDPQYIRQVIRVLETYFSQLDSKTPNFAESYTADDFFGGRLHGDGSEVYVPYNQFYSMLDQSAAAIDIAYPVKLENTVFTNGIYISGVDDTRITFSKAGIYTITFSLAFQNTTNAVQTVDVWFRFNDGTGVVDVPDSNSRFTISARKAAGVPSYLIATTAFTGFAPAPDVYVELVFRVSDTAVNMEHLDAVTFSAGVTPAIPATPSAIVQANFVSKAVGV
jgi:hypothetical protein